MFTWKIIDHLKWLHQSLVVILRQLDYGKISFIALIPDWQASVAVLLVVVVGVHGPGEAEVCNFGHQVLVDEDVPSGEITMDALSRMQVGHPLGNLE